MYSYDLLEAGCCYLVKVKEDASVTMIKVAIISDHCVFIQQYSESMETEWKLKSDNLFDIIECLSDQAVKAWETHFRSNQGAFYEEDEEE